MEDTPVAVMSDRIAQIHSLPEALALLDEVLDDNSAQARVIGCLEAENGRLEAELQQLRVFVCGMRSPQ